MINQLNINGIVYASVVLGSKLYIVGSFTTVNGLVRNSFVEIDLSTGDPTSFAPSFDGAIYGIEVCASSLIMFGGFSHVNALSATSHIVVLDQLSMVFSDPISTLGLTDVSGTIPGNAPTASILQIKYHQNSGYAFIVGTFAFSRGAEIRKYLLTFNPTSWQLAPIDALMNNFIIRTLDIDQSSGIMYYAGYTRIGNTPTIASFNISNSLTITNGSWLPPTPTQLGGGHILFSNNKVFLSSFNAGPAATINGIQYQGLMAFDSTTGAIDTSNWQLFKQVFQGEAYAKQINFLNGKYYVLGHFSSILSNGNDGIQRPSIFLRNTAGSFFGENIAFNGPAIISYINGSHFYQNEPDVINSGIFDGDKLHIFGYLPWVDGKPCNNHYIMNANGTRIQQRAAVFL